jgi:hypothetical protein
LKSRPTVAALWTLALRLDAGTFILYPSSFLLTLKNPCRC